MSASDLTTTHRAPSGAPDFSLWLVYKHLAPNGAKNHLASARGGAKKYSYEEFLTQT